MIAHDCTRQYEVVSFIECQNPDVNSGWALDRYFTDRRTRAEVLEVRKYSKASVLPLLYTGACLPPNLSQAPAESLTVQELKCGGMRKLPVTCGSVVLNRCCGQYCRGHVLKAFLS